MLRSWLFEEDPSMGYGFGPVFSGIEDPFWGYTTEFEIQGVLWSCARGRNTNNAHSELQNWVGLWAWYQALVIPALRRLNQGGLWVSGQLGLPGKTLCHLKTGRKKGQQDDPDVKMFATQHRDLSLEPQHPHKRLDIVAQVCKPMLRRWRQGSQGI